MARRTSQQGSTTHRAREGKATPLQRGRETFTGTDEEGTHSTTTKGSSWKSSTEHGGSSTTQKNDGRKQHHSNEERREHQPRGGAGPVVLFVVWCCCCCFVVALWAPWGCRAVFAMVISLWVVWWCFLRSPFWMVASSTAPSHPFLLLLSSANLVYFLKYNLVTSVSFRVLQKKGDRQHHPKEETSSSTPEEEGKRMHANPKEGARLEPRWNRIWIKQVSPRCCLVFWDGTFHGLERFDGAPEGRGLEGGGALMERAGMLAEAGCRPMFSFLSVVAAREEVAPAFRVLPVK